MPGQIWLHELESFIITLNINFVSSWFFSWLGRLSPYTLSFGYIFAVLVRIFIMWQNTWNAFRSKILIFEAFSRDYFEIRYMCSNECNWDCSLSRSILSSVGIYDMLSYVSTSELWGILEYIKNSWETCSNCQTICARNKKKWTEVAAGPELTFYSSGRLHVLSNVQNRWRKRRLYAE